MKSPSPGRRWSAGAQAIRTSARSAAPGIFSTGTLSARFKRPSYPVMLMLLMLASNAASADEWSTENTALEASYATLLAVDYLQTRHAIGKPGYIEKNPLLGKRPNMAELNLAAVVFIAGHYVIARNLPEPWRENFQIITAAIEFSVVADNYRIGLSVKF